MPFDFSSYEAVLMDLDGTLFKDDQPLPGAVALVRRLQSGGPKIAFPSNSTQSPGRLVKRLGGMGLDLTADVIFTAAGAAVEYCLQKFAPTPRIFNLATEGVAEMLEGKAIAVEGEGQACDAVLIGNPQCVFATRERINIGHRLLRAGAACLGICDDRAYPSPHGLEIGSGAMTRMLAYAAGATSTFFGKPQKTFFENLCRKLDVRAEKCILIGDNLESDIAGAGALGMKTILCLTGVARRSDIGMCRPDWVVNDLTEL